MILIPCSHSDQLVAEQFGDVIRSYSNVSKDVLGLDLEGVVEPSNERALMGHEVAIASLCLANIDFDALDWGILHMNSCKLDIHDVVLGDFEHEGSAIGSILVSRRRRSSVCQSIYRPD